MGRMNRRAVISLCAVLMMVTVARAIDTTNHVPIGIVEKVGETLPMNTTFINEKGEMVALKDIVTKPTIFNFVYYRCPGICSPILTELTTIVNYLDLEIGKDYQIVTISFDDREKFDLGAAKKESYMNLLKKPIPPSAWTFLSGDSASIHAVTDAAGFYFRREGSDFVHAGAIIAVSPHGKIARYLNGTKFLPFDVKMAITEASAERTGPTIAKLVAYCYSYNPEGRTYVFNVTRVAGGGILFFAMVFIVYLTIKPKKNNPTKS